MLMRMNDENGHPVCWHNAEQNDVEQMKKAGWIESSPEDFANEVEKKRAKQETLQAKPKGKPGRKPTIKQ